jgi:ribosomal protein S3
MGQKINPTIFRLGVNKTWKTEFFEKKNRELPLYVFKDLEIKNYIERVLEIHGILVHDYKQYYNNSTLNLYISYFVTPDFLVDKKKMNEKITIKSPTREKSIIKNFLPTNHHYSWMEVDKESDNLFKNFYQPYKFKRYLNLNSYTQLFAQKSLIHLLEFVETQGNKYVKKSFSDAQVDGVFNKIFTVLSLFLGSQLNITANFCCINKDVQFLKFIQKDTFISFQKFRNTPFLKEGIELLFNVSNTPNSAHLLAKFIAFQFKKVKRHKFFLSFLKQTLTILLTSSLSKLKGVKIIVKGRLNGVPRAKHKVIIIGDVPVQTISAKLDYSQATAHNSNGSYGIKVWVVEK